MGWSLTLKSWTDVYKLISTWKRRKKHRWGMIRWTFPIILACKKKTTHQHAIVWLLLRLGCGFTVSKQQLLATDERTAGGQFLFAVCCDCGPSHNGESVRQVDWASACSTAERPRLTIHYSTILIRLLFLNANVCAIKNCLHNSDYLIRDTISGGILQMQKLRMLSAGIQNWQRSPLLNLE